MASNVQVTRQQTLERVLTELGHREETILGMLPPDLPIERFRANVTNALRSNAQLLDAEPNSLVQACMKAAYDGLRIDGREAAIVIHDTTFGRNTQNERKVKLAQYYPMVFGIIQQIMRGGEVASMYADVIRENDEYEVRRGTAPGIHHRPLLTGERGAIIGAYSVATLKSGAVTFEFLDRQDLADIRSAAKTQDVWKRWEGEQSKKSAVRRHRKTLPLGDRDIVIRDAEAEDLYPDMHGERESLPAPSPRAMPTRQQIADRQGSESGMAMDLEDDREGAVVEQQEKAKPAHKKRVQQEAAGRAGDDALPADEGEWNQWANGVDSAIVAAKDAAAVNAIAQVEEARLKAAPKEHADYLRGLISDRLTDLAIEEQGA